MRRESCFYIVLVAIVTMMSFGACGSDDSTIEKNVAIRGASADTTKSSDITVDTTWKGDTTICF